MSPSKVSSISWDSFSNVVDGKNRSADNFHQGVDPTTGQKLWDVPIATQQDVDDAVEAGLKAFQSWSQTTLDERRDYIRKYIELYKRYENEMTELLKKETGKPHFWANYEVNAVCGFLEYHLSLEMPETTIEDKEKTIVTRWTPLGVVGAICPWNFPLILSFGKIAPAMITGNPSPFTPYSILKGIELAQEVFPPGVIQVLGGDDRLGPMMTQHPGIAKISFTGSIATGKKIMAACAPTLKRVTLELGGNDASIVMPDVDIQAVAPQLVLGAFQNSGQVCVATKRIYIHESIYNETLEAMSKFASSLKIGSPDDEGVHLGPIQNSMQYERVKGFFEDVAKHEYKFAAGSKEIPSGKGYFIQPAIIDNPPNDSRIIVEEPFGPIVPTQPWSDLDEVIARANDTNTGLGACVWGKDAKQTDAVARRLQAGSVWVNSFEKPSPMAIFGGVKESGIGGYSYL
ncbi:hypothetical protein MBLNU457_2126t1 [Dothideomycetes sp. NU457]